MRYDIQYAVIQIEAEGEPVGDGVVVAPFRNITNIAGEYDAYYCNMTSSYNYNAVPFMVAPEIPHYMRRVIDPDGTVHHVQELPYPTPQSPFFA